MLKKLATLTTLSVLALSISGCGGGIPKPVLKQLQSKKPVSVTFPKVDPVTNETLQVHPSTFTAQIESYSKYNHYKRYRRFESLNYYKGILVKNDGNKYSINYIHDIKDRETRGKNFYRGSKTTFLLPYTIKDSTITFQYPTSYNHSVDSGLGAAEPLDKEEKLVKDFNRIYNSLPHLYIKKYFELTGSVNTEYPDKAVYANFKRLLGEYNWRGSDERFNSIKKENTFALRLQNGQIVPLHIEVYPYRNGSKVTYSTIIPYKLTKDGATLSKEDIQNLKKKIEQIAND